MAVKSESGCARVLTVEGLGELISKLRQQEYEVLGPTLGEGALVYGPLHSIQDLPRGWTEEQEAGTYRLKRSEDGAYFGYRVGPQSLKRYLNPPRRKLWSAERGEGGIRFKEPPEAPPRYAFLGVRACELEALAIQDRVLLGAGQVDPGYARLRERAFLVAVNCTSAAPTCFCASMGCGPRAKSGYDLVLTELLEPGRQVFLAEAGSELGAGVLTGLPGEPAGEPERQAAAAVSARAEGQIQRKMETKGLKELLYRSIEHPRWSEVASRCQACANCTLVCPTCFCSTVEDLTDLSGAHAERWQRWDSCFTMHFSHLHGGAVRSSTASRYRQWLTHKLAAWVDQFGTSGCVGCGRCIAWCPVGIDLTEEVAVLRAGAQPAQRKAQEGAIHDLREVLGSHPFFRDLKAEYLDLITGCAWNARYRAGSMLFQEGDRADRFYLLRSGRVSLRMDIPGRAPLVLQTFGPGEVLGWSWLVPPHRFAYTATAEEDTRAFALDGDCLRRKCEENHDLGFELFKRFAPIMEQRIQTTRLQLMDIYEHDRK